MGLFDEKTREKLKEILQGLKEEVHILFFTQEFECKHCGDAREFLKEIEGLSMKLTLTIYDFINDKNMADEYGVDNIPAIVLLNSRREDTGIRFLGIPAGYEINSFVKGLLEVSGNRELIPEPLIERIRKIDKKINIDVYISLSCPYCPQAVSAAHRLALENKNIKASMIDGGIFYHLAAKHNVSSVPKTIINGKNEILGAVPLEKLVQEIEKL